MGGAIIEKAHGYFSSGTRRRIVETVVKKLDLMMRMSKGRHCEMKKHEY